jgi:hypothetical protein
LVLTRNGATGDKVDDDGDDNDDDDGQNDYDGNGATGGDATGHEDDDDGDEQLRQQLVACCMSKMKQPGPGGTGFRSGVTKRNLPFTWN